MSDITGITVDLLRHGRPLSVVFPEFMHWLEVTTKEVSEAPQVDTKCITSKDISFVMILILSHSIGSSEWLSLRFPHCYGRNRSQTKALEHQPPHHPGCFVCRHTSSTSAGTRSHQYRSPFFMAVHSVGNERWTRCPGRCKEIWSGVPLLPHYSWYMYLLAISESLAQKWT